MFRITYFRAFVLALGLMLVGAASVRAQSTHATIFGRVVDQKTRAPLADANVFIANTMLGSATDQDGRYEIRGLPPGSYELVVSVVGYESEKVKLNITKPTDIERNFRLKPTVLEMEPLEVSAEETKEWEKQLEKFTRLFLGTSKNAEKCRILNPEVLDFEKETAKKPFRAVAHAPLEIKNRALGYHVTFVLRQFESKDDEVTYAGDASFRALSPESEEEERQWQENRLNTYRGSMRHFLSTLYDNGFYQEGFLAFLVPNLYQEKHSPQRRKIRGPEILRAGNLPGEKYLDYGFLLEIVYTEELEAEEYIDYRIAHDYSLINAPPRIRRQAEEPRSQTSWLALKRPPVSIDEFGRLHDPLYVKTFGYWAWMRVAEMLPWEYDPDKDTGFAPPPVYVERNYYERGLEKLEAGDWEAALSIWLEGKNYMHQFDKADPRIGIAFIELATKIGALKYYVDATDLYYWGFSQDNLNDFKDAVREEVERLAPLLSDEARKAWQKDLKKGRFDLYAKIKNFWIERDPTPTTLLNERLTTHWERIAYARQNFTKARTSPYGTDDRGTIYVKYGPPHKKLARTLGSSQVELMRLALEGEPADNQHVQGFTNQVDLSGPDRAARLREGLARFHYLPECEAWAYYNLHEDETVVFLFGPEGGHGPFGLRNSVEEFIPSQAFSRRNTKYAGGMLPGAILQMMYYNDLAAFDDFFADRFQELENIWTARSADHSVFRATRSRFLLADRNDPLKKYAPPEHYSADKFVRHIPMVATRARLLDDQDRPRLLFLAFAAPPGVEEADPLAMLEADAQAEDSLRFSLLARNANMEEVERRVTDPKDPYDHLAHFEVPHTVEYQHYTVVAATHSRNFPQNVYDYSNPKKVARAHFEGVEPLNTERDELEVSDLILGVEPPPNLTAEVLPIPVVPTTEIRGDVLKVYLEVYHLRLAKDGYTRFSLESKVIKLEPKDEGFERKELVATSFDFDQRGITAREHFGISVANYEPGDYELEIEVVDRISGKKKKRVAQFRIIE